MSGCDTVLAVNDDGLLIEPLASLKSVRAKDDDRGGPIDPDNTGVDFKGQKRSNATHQSVTDPDAKLYFTGHAMSEHRHGLVVDFAVADVLSGERTPRRVTTWSG